VSPILGIWASQNYVRIPPTAYDSIQTISAGGTASATFTSIPSTYKHLQIRALVRGSAASTIDVILMRFNGDGSSSNYVTLHQIYGSGTTAAAQSSTGNGFIYQSYIAGNSAGANTFSPYITDILDYTSANKNKTTRTLAGTDNNGSGYVTFSSGLWLNSSTAISSINMVLDNAGNFATGTQFALYGIRG
jgi:hypothetical protein